METAHVLASVAALWLFAVITPGPNFLVTVRFAVGHSRRHGIFAVLGVISGAALWSLAGYFGLQTLFTLAPWTYRGVKVTGGCYLVYVGLRMILNSGGGASTAPAQIKGSSAYTAALLTSLSNPKVIIFVTSIFASALPRNPSPLLCLQALAIMMTISFCWYGIVTFFFGSERIAAAYRSSRTWLDRTAGAFFLLFGATLALKH